MIAVNRDGIAVEEGSSIKMRPFKLPLIFPNVYGLNCCLCV